MNASGSVPLGVDSEVGRLRSVILHRPGDELKRLTPRNNDELLFDALPWVDRAQEEHDQFATVLRERGVEVLLLSDLLTEALEVSGAARIQGIAAAVDARKIGHALGQHLAAYLRQVEPKEQLVDPHCRNDVRRAADRCRLDLVGAQDASRR